MTSGSVVYFALFGEHVKIGYSTNLPNRIKSFETSTAHEIQILATMSGGRKEEARLHNEFFRSRIKGEFFRRDRLVDAFIARLNSKGVDAAWALLDRLNERERERMRKRQAALRRERDAVARAAMIDKNAYFASLVAERKRVRGW